MKRIRCDIVGAMVLLVLGFSQVSAGKSGRCFYMGFTPFPWDMSQEAVNQTNKFIVANGDLISQQFDDGVPWTEALEGKPFPENVQGEWIGRKAISTGKKIFLSLTPLNQGRSGMAPYRGERDNMPLPPAFAGKAFDDTAVETAYLNYCLRAISYFKPDYVAIGIEVNELIHNDRAAWGPFTKLYSHTFAGIKKQFPKLPVCATISLHNLTNKGWKDMDFEQKEIREFVKGMDFVAISYYPFMAGQSDKPVEVFDWLRKFTDKPLAISETGYPAETIRLKTFNVTIPATADDQKTYYETLLKRATDDKYLFVVSFLSRDYDAMWEKIKASSPEAFVVWKDCGMLDGKGRQRPALKVWKRYLAMKYIDSSKGRK